MKKRWLATILALTMCLSLLPMTAFATEGGDVVTGTGSDISQTDTSTEDTQAGGTGGEGEETETLPEAAELTTIYVSNNGGEGNNGDAAGSPITLTGAFEKISDDTSSGAFVVSLTEDITLTQSITVNKKVTLKLNTHKITVDFTNVETETTASAFEVNTNGDLTVQNGTICGVKSLSFNGNGILTNADAVVDNRAFEGETGSKITLTGVTAYNFAAKSGNGGVVSVEGGELVIGNSSLGYYDYQSETEYYNYAQSGGAVYAKNVIVTASNTNFFYGRSLAPNAKPGSPYEGGGAIYAACGTLNVDNCYFFDNRTTDYGGAIHLDGVENAYVKNSRISDSMANNHKVTNANGKLASTGGDGGAIYSRISKKVTIENNEIKNSMSYGKGGGVCVIGDTGGIVTFRDNIISDNTAKNRGGGLSFILTSGSTVNLESGTISNNEADWGGGIDYTTHNMPALQLTNVLITGNSAARGGGIWACPTSETKCYSTLGGAIFGNTANGTVSWFDRKTNTLSASGSEVRYEGSDYEDGVIKLTSNSSTMSVMQRTLGGGLMQWYADETDDRYETGDLEVAPSYYTNKDTSFGLYGELSTTYQTLAQSEAKLIISNNTATDGRGGGIATNSPIVIGMEDQDVTVKVTKSWPEDATEHPEEVKVDLYRIGTNDSDDSGRVQLDSNVVLNADNKWAATFTDLPAKYVGADGKVYECTYEVVERPLDGWACTSASIFNENTKTYTITLTNSPAGNLTVSKTVTGSSTEEKFSFHVALSDATISGTYGDVIFADGVAEFSLKNGESITATGLPAEITYTVTEDSVANFTTTSTNDTGKIVAGQTATAAFVNTYKSSGGGGSTKPPVLNTEDHYGYIIGYPEDYETGEKTTDQTRMPVKPEGSITRAEVATIFFRLLTDDARNEYWSQTSSYTDVEADDWFNNAICTLSKAGILDGYEDGTFRPNGKITRAEFATIASRFFQYADKNIENPFSDVEEGAWYYQYIMAASDMGLINGYPDGTFQPNNPITRAESCAIVNRTLDRHPEQEHFLEDMLVWVDNMDTEKWYYEDMQEATNSHAYQIKTSSDGKYEIWTKMLPIRDWSSFEKEWSDANSAAGGEVVK